jgi:hypothetical protein
MQVMSDIVTSADATSTDTADTANGSDPPKGWRALLPVHPAAELFPLMAGAELRELGENIKGHGGLIQAVHLYKGKLLDGRNRLDAAELVGFTFDNAGLNGFAHHLPDSVDPYEYVIAANLHRRHLTADQRRELIAKVLKAKPEASNATIAKQTKADDKTVARVRRKLESTSEIPKLEKTVGADGKRRGRPLKRKAATVETTEERDRKTCIELNRKALDAERERAQWLVDHSTQRVTASPEISIKRRQAENARLDQPGDGRGNPGVTKLATSKKNLEWFAVACREYLPNVTVEAHRQEARRLVAELTAAFGATP